MTARTNQPNNIMNHETNEALGSGQTPCCHATAEGQGEGPVQQLVAPAAKRSGTGTLPDEGSEAVAPGESALEAAEWLLYVARSYGKAAAEQRKKTNALTIELRRLASSDLERAAEDYYTATAQPDSEGSDSELRGRRNE